jgi:hypothetical protein
MIKSGRNNTPKTVEVNLEELDAHSWLRAVPDTVTEPYGRGQFRFVVVPATGAAANHSFKDHLAFSVSFPALRLQDPDGPTQPDAWLDMARRRLADLDSELCGAGWRRKPGRGRYWWSLTYDTVAEPAESSDAVPALEGGGVMTALVVYG